MKVSGILFIVSVVAALTALTPKLNAENVKLKVSEPCDSLPCQAALNTIRNECKLTVKSGEAPLGCEKERLKKLLAEFIASNAFSKVCEGCTIEVE